jgi:Lysylphosphatidylglycerol synthase TM region
MEDRSAEKSAEPPAPGGGGTGTGFGGRLLRVAAWIVTAGLLGWLLWRTPFSQVIAATRAAAPWTVPVGLLLLVALYFADSFAIWKTFGWFLARLSLTQILIVRGATYLLAAINYSVGQGAIVYFVHRATGAPILRGVATVLLIMGINILALLFLTSAGLVIAPDVPHGLYLIVGVAYVGLALYAIALIVRPRWLAARPIFDVLLAAGWRGHLRALAVRLPHIATLIALQTLMLRAFGVHVPLVNAIASLPVVFFVAVLPISVQGIGTTQAAMVFFFARFASGDQTTREAAVLAESLVTQALSLGFQSLLGIACLRSRIGRDLRAAKPAGAATGDRAPDPTLPHTPPRTPPQVL